MDKNYRVILFDLDGVIVDTKRNMEISWATVRAVFEIDTPFERYFELIGIPFDEIVVRLGLGKLATEIRMVYNLASSCRVDLVSPYSGCVEVIKKKGLAKADKKAEREIKAGLIKTYTHNDRVGVVLKVGFETDFVARSEPFKELVHNLAVHIVATDPANVDELMAQPFVKDEGTSVEDLVKGVIAKTGENIKIDGFYRLEL